MKMDRARALRRGCLALLLAASQSQAQSHCSAPQSVALDVLDGAEPSSEQLQQIERLERSVIAELGASQISVCDAPPAPAPSLARVLIRATRPRWQRASIRFEAASAPAIERSLDVSKLPPEARALAIASATDELVRSALAEPVLAPAEAPSAPPPEADRPAPLAAAAPLEQRETSARAPVVEAGLAAAGSSYWGQREAFEADVAARYWLLPRVPISARFGVAQRLTRPNERGAVQPDADVHAALGAGLTLWNEPGLFDVIGEAGVQLSRVGFDERMKSAEALGFSFDYTDDAGDAAGFTDVVAPPQPVGGDQPLDHGWALAASLGIEGRVRTGPVGFSLALAGLVPLVPARSDWGNQTSLDALGVQLRAGIWVLLGSRQE
jgi:hypothetical protein